MFESRVEHYELPKGWTTTRLDEACLRMRQGQILPTNEIKEVGAYPVYGANGRIGYTDSYFLDEERVLITCRGSTCGVINMSPAKSFVTNNAMILFEKDFLDKYYLYFALHEFSTMGLRTGSGQPQLTQGILNSHKLPVPPITEQRQLARVLRTVQQAIAQQERLIRTTTELKQALMQKLFTEGLRGEAQKETEIGLVPESWLVVTLGDLGRVVTGTTPSTTVPEYYAPEEADFVAPADIGNTRQVKDSEKKISMAGYAVCRPLPPDSVMCVCIGATIGKVGMSTKLHSATNQQINSIICSKQHDPRFMYYFLLHHAAYWRGFATFGTMPMLSKGAFEKIPLYVPSDRDEQSDIADALVAVDDKIEVAGKKRNQLQDLFRTLLHELMTGKVRVGEQTLSTVN